jgi:hypothetical protein
MRWERPHAPENRTYLCSSPCRGPYPTSTSRHYASRRRTSNSGVQHTVVIAHAPWWRGYRMLRECRSPPLWYEGCLQSITSCQRWQQRRTRLVDCFSQSEGVETIGATLVIALATPPLERPQGSPLQDFNKSRSEPMTRPTSPVGRIGGS